MLTLLALLAACGGPDAAPDDTVIAGTCDSTDHKATYVISILEFTEAC